MKKISLVTPCYNEEENVLKLISSIEHIFMTLGNYDYEHIFIDNASTDKTLSILKEVAVSSKNVKIISNSRNFGHIRSPFHGLKQATGDAVILIVADLQDPPELIYKFITEWESGNEIVIGVKTKSLESPLMYFVRSTYYSLVKKLSEIELTKNFTGFGLYDKKIIEILKKIDDPYPYFRGLVFELGFNVKKIEFTQPSRKRGLSKNNFYTLYDIAMLGICTHSKVPLRLATILGFIFSTLSFLISVVYLIQKLIFWDNFALGVAPIVIGLFFVASIQLFLLGLVGEYVGWILTRVTNRPLVYEKERINF